MGFTGQEPSLVADIEYLWKVDGPRLLILDNFEDVTKTGKVLSRFQHSALRLLITSRRKDFPKSAGLQIQELGLFNEEESSEFLSKTLKRKESRSAKKQLAEKLGYLPLAIEMAASYININDMDISEYLHEIENIISHESMQAEWFKGLDIINPTEHDQSLLATFQLSWQEVKDEIIRKIFGYLCVLAPFTGIPLVVLREALEIDKKTISKGIYRLKMLNLLISSDDSISIHPLLAKFGGLVIEDVFRDNKKKILGISINRPRLTGSISTPIVSEANGSVPSSIIRTDQNWQIEVNWTMEGSFLDKAFFFINGEWIVRIYLEPMGTKAEYELPKGGNGTRVKANSFTLDGLTKRNYTATIKVVPKTVDPGIYKMIVAVTAETSSGVPGPFAGFIEGVTLQLYEPV